MAGSHRRFAAALAGLLAAAGPLLASAPAHAADATASSSSVTVTDHTGDVTDPNNVPISGAPQFDISSVGASDQDGRIVLKMVTGGADDLATSVVMWGLFTDPNATADSDPDYVVIPTHDNDVWSVLVNPGSDVLDPGNQLCPTGTSMAYDAAGTSYTAAFNASCIGSPASFRFQAVRFGIVPGDSGNVTVGDMAPDGALSDTVTAGTSSTTGTSGAAHGYWMVGSDGKVYSFGDAVKSGEPAGSVVAPIVDLEPTASGDGYWVVDELGHVYAYGTAKAFAPFDSSKLLAGEKVTSLSATPQGDGYWLFTSKGRVFTFGAAQNFGDLSNKVLNGAVLDSVATPKGNGYYMVASDGGVFAFGDANFAGSMGDKKLNAPVQSLVPDPDGAGYWLVASDGGIFAFDAAFRGSMGDKTLNRPVTGMVAFGNGYLMVGEDGGIFNFSDQPFDGSLGANPPAHPIVSVAALARA